MSINDWIKLNVGGRHFETTRLTLVACPDSLLANMFSLESSRPASAVSADEHGAFKIDADPDIFGILLNCSSLTIERYSLRMSLNDWITLNVGGRHFETTRLTLVACPDSLLANMFSLESSRPAAAVSTDGAFKIDADPDVFGILLNWLRRKKLMMTDGIRLENVAVEAEFFGLIDLKDAVEEQKREFREEQKRKEEKEDKWRKEKEEKEEKWRKEDKDMQLRKEIKEEQQRNEDKEEKRWWREKERARKQEWRREDKMFG